MFVSVFSFSNLFSFDVILFNEKFFAKSTVDHFKNEMMIVGLEYQSISTLVTINKNRNEFNVKLKNKRNLSNDSMDFLYLFKCFSVLPMLLNFSLACNKSFYRN